MAARSVWKGFIGFGLVTLPVKAYTASASGGGSISLNQIHKDCGKRIKYAKTCPEHGEVPSSEIVSGYQHVPDEYVIIDPSELDKLRSPKEKAVTIVAFIKPDVIDPSLYSGRTLYLVPDGPVGFKPYTLLVRTMMEKDSFAFAQVVFSGKDQVVLLRPTGGLLAMTFLSFASEVRPPGEFSGEVPKAEATAQEVKMAKLLVESMTDDNFDFSQYKDTYSERLQQLIESKISGKEIVASKSEELPMLNNLMDALQKSLDKTKAGAKKKPPKLAAPSKPATGAAKRRKSS